MPRKAKKYVHPMPPLSALDKVIYLSAIWLLAIAGIAFLFSGFWVREVLAFRDEAVIAYDTNSQGWNLPFSFLLLFFALWIYLDPYNARLPLFGRRNFRYGPPAWPRTYPLLMKNRPKPQRTPRQRIIRKRICIAVIVISLACSITIPWGLCQRDCLNQNGSITAYNIWNAEKDNYLSGQIESVEFKAYRTSRRRRSWRKQYHVQVIMTTRDGEQFTFVCFNFQDDEHWVHAMLQLKARYTPEIIHYSGAEYLQDVIDYYDMTTDEAQLLYQLFNME